MKGAAELYLKNEVSLKDYKIKSIINDAILGLDLQGLVGRKYFWGNYI